MIVLLFSLHRYYSFFASYDQGLFNQLFWNSIRGHFFQSSLSSAISGSTELDGQIPYTFYYHLGQHFVIDFLLWLPLYALFPSNVTLITLQVGLITVAGLVLYRLARHYLQPAIAAMITASYYGATAVIGPTFANFYELCQVPLFVFGVLLALEQRRWWWFWLMIALTLGIREDTGIILFGIGVSLIASRRSVRLGLAVCVLSFTYVSVVTNVIMPLFSKDNSKLYLATYFSQFVNSKEPTTLELLGGIITHPKELLISLFTPFDKRLLFLLGQWLPLAFVPAIAAPAWIISSFPLLELLLQHHSDALALGVRYAWTVVPGIFYGTILWWSNHHKLLKPEFRRFWMICIALSASTVVIGDSNFAFYFVIPDSIRPWHFYTTLNRQWEHRVTLQTLLNSIPADASVSGTTYVIPQLSSRREVIRLPDLQMINDQRQKVEVEYVLADLLPMHKYHKAFTQRHRLRAMVPVIDEALTQNRYGILNLQDKVVLLKKNAPSDPKSLTAWSQLREELRPIWEKHQDRT